MLWTIRRHEPAPQDARVAPTLPLDEGLFQARWAACLRDCGEVPGLAALVEALAAKGALFQEALAPDALDRIDLDGLEVLLDRVFTARRRIFPALARLGADRLRVALRDLLYGRSALRARVEAFADSLGAGAGADGAHARQAQKLRRAARDFAAECLHFNDPLSHPLMTCWVWDQATASGALREFVAGGESGAEISLGMAPEMFEDARSWLATQVAGQGIYRDLPLIVDIVLASAYAAYFHAMARGMVSMEFGRGVEPIDAITQFLGIDEARGRRSRVRKSDGLADGPA
ncbi:MAG: hypothetical protein M0T84_16815 [Betaproteobacteria bacterium]|nr:hypothetical protein [Betaproteobacteria bacterium]